MPLPTDGYSTEGVTYTLGTSNNLTVKVTLTTDNAARQTAADEFLPYLDSALDNLRTDYQSGTSETVLYIDRTYNGSVHDNL